MQPILPTQSNTQPSLQQQELSKQYDFYIDSHTHLLDYDRQSHLSLQQVLKESKIAGVRLIAANTCCTNQFMAMEELFVEFSKLNEDISTKNDHQSPPSPSALTIIPCFGIHPCYICQELKQLNPQKDWKDLLKHYLKKYPFSHVGEIGLDFRKDVIETNPQDKQWEFFEYQFQLGYEMGRSVTVHCVRAYGELLKFLKKWNAKKVDSDGKSGKTKEQGKNGGTNGFCVILHSYGGSKEITKSLLKLTNIQIYFSLSLKHSKDILQIIPIEKLILETDAPYQNDHKVITQNNLWTQQSLQQQSKSYQQRSLQHVNLLKECKFFNKSVLDNRPKNVIANYREICKAYKMEENTFCRKVTQNALRAFRLIK